MKTTIATLIFIVLLGGACSSDKQADYTPKLPPITQTGANTFGAIINGQVMIPRNSIGYIPPGNSHNAVNYIKSDNWEKISASDSRTTMGGIYMYIQNTEKNYPLKVDKYNIGNSTGEFEESFAENTLITANVYDKNGNAKIYLSIADTGSITLTRSDNDIISGTFSCKLKYKDNPNDIIEIKEGRFDFTKNTINSTDFK